MDLRQLKKKTTFILLDFWITNSQRTVYVPRTTFAGAGGAGARGVNLALSAGFTCLMGQDLE